MRPTPARRARHARQHGATDPTDWQVIGGLPLHCPSGQLHLGDVTGSTVTVPVEDGAGRYVVDLYHRGREPAVQHLTQLEHRAPGRMLDDA